MVGDGDMILVLRSRGASIKQREILWLLVRWRLGDVVASGSLKAWRGGGSMSAVS